MADLRWTWQNGVAYLSHADAHNDFIASIHPTLDYWRPYVHGQAHTKADDLEAARATIAAVLRCEVPVVPGRTP